MPNLKTGKSCCGCTACAAVCGHNAIIMKPDSLGFKYPKVDLSKCVECGLCERVCSFNPEYRTTENFKSPIPYGCRLKSTDELMKSRSGGAFVALSDLILNKGGVIYGVGYNEHFKVAHKRATTKEERDEFRGSKYVQTDLDGIFQQIMKDLLDGKWVMFTGVGCQVAGLKAFIPKKLQERLFTIDIVCHGVPSPKIWEDYIDYLENKTGKTIIKVNFRDKRFGWTTHKESYTFKDSTQLVSTEFTELFYKHIMLRPSCGNCFYCNLRRPSDLTIADFWGWERTKSKLNEDNRGLSLVLVNTPKGEALYKDKACQDKLIAFETSLKDCMQSHLERPTVLNKNWKKFQKIYEKKGFNGILRRYGKNSFQCKVHKIIGKCKTLLKRLKKFC